VNSEQKIQALCRIKASMEELLAIVPDEYARLHGMREINQSYQLCKVLIAHEIMDQEHSVEAITGACVSLALHNME